MAIGSQASHVPYELTPGDLMNEKPPSVESLLASVPEVESAEFLARGGYKSVYRAAIGGTTQALKAVLIPQNVASGTPGEPDRVLSENIRRIRRELDILDARHSNYLVKLGTLNPRLEEIGGSTYLVYSEEFLLGEDLASRIRARRIPDCTEVARLIKILATLINELWQHQIVHRDIKPANIMLTHDPAREFVLIDFGLAFIAGGSGITHNLLNIPCTPRYVAPEMLSHGFRKELDYRADIFATGLVLFEYVTNIHPFEQPGDAELVIPERIASESPKKLLDIRPEFPKPLASCIMDMLHRNRLLRPTISQILTIAERYI